MKYVMVFLVLSLVVLMADPGECFFRSIWRGAKAAFRGAKAGWKGPAKRQTKATTINQMSVTPSGLNLFILNTLFGVTALGFTLQERSRSANKPAVLGLHEAFEK
ncbi:pleurocidin-like peptide WF3, partial [Scomber scombrus]